MTFCRTSAMRVEIKGASPSEELALLYQDEQQHAAQTLWTKITRAVTPADMKKAKDFFDNNNSYFSNDKFDNCLLIGLFDPQLTTPQALKLVMLAENARVIVPRQVNLADFILNLIYREEIEGFHQKVIALTQYLIAKGALVNSVSTDSTSFTGVSKVSPLTAVIEIIQNPITLVALVELLLKNHANPNVVVTGGQTLLEYVKEIQQDVAVPSEITAYQQVAEKLKEAGGR